MGVAQTLVNQDEQFMREALALGVKARAIGEVPVGAIVVVDGAIVGEGFNQPIQSNDASAHAEIVALRNAGNHLSNYRLVDATLYVTIEPCMMCAGALLHSRIARLVYGAQEPKAGAIASHTLLGAAWQNHQIEVMGGVLAAECSAMMSDFFKSRRKQVVAE